jgi:hypothetical protein
MKKVVTIVLVFVLVLSLGGIVAFAEKPVEARCFYGTNNGWVCDYQNLGCAFGNGCLANYCGNYGTGVNVSGYVSERPVVNQTPVSGGSSNQSYSGGGQSYGGSSQNYSGSSQSTGWSGGGYQGSGYVDNNGDGYCDNWSGSYGGGHHGGGHGGRHHR